MITLNEKEVQDLVAYINTIPTQYGYGLIKFIGDKVTEANKKEEATVEKGVIDFEEVS